MAAFMLHQAAEQALRAMLIVHTGLRINTHNLDKLVRYCSMFDYRLPDIFPGRTEKDKRLFVLLQKAYIGARYKDEYSLCYMDFTALKEKVALMMKRLEVIVIQTANRSV